MARRFYKHKLLLDEGFHLKKHLPLLNNLFDVKHIAADFKQGGMKDPDVYKLASKQDRILVTYNIKDFKKLVMYYKETGIIGVSPNLFTEQIDKKLVALLKKATKKDLYGKMTFIKG